MCAYRTGDRRPTDYEDIEKAALSLYMSTLAGSTLIHDVGYMDMGITASWELIEKVGPGGHFLMEDHTLEHYRDVWYPKVINREEYSVWAGKGAKPLREVLREKVRWILENHHPKQLPEDVEAKIGTILKKANAEIASAAEHPN